MACSVGGRGKRLDGQIGLQQRDRQWRICRGRSSGLRLPSHLIVPGSASLRVTNAITLEAWVNPSSVSGSTPRTIISKLDYPNQPNGSQSAYLLGLTNNGRLFFTVSATGSARTNTTLVTTQTLPINQWSFIVATYDGAALRIYLNGALAISDPIPAGIFLAQPTWPPCDSGRQLRIRLALQSSARTKSHSTTAPLTDGEIQAIFNADLVGKCLVAPTIGHQPQDQAIPLVRM